ncbi:MAG: FtsX-like permease family protein, partial [Gemmatimonadetes bacterium]|nr:FtsX-like permease family protein [Gemmatimonadota bacterium]
QEGWGVSIVSLHDDIVGGVRPMLMVVFGAVCFVLLIACANVANLLMSRASEREQEMAVRSAMGAGRGRLVRQLLLESSILAGVGGLVGIGLTQWAIATLVRATPDLPRLETVGLDAGVLAFALAATGFTAVLFGLAPAVSLGRSAVAGGLGSRGSVTTVRMRRLRGALVVVQVALSLVLLVGAGLLVRSLANRLDVGVGFEVENLLTTQVQLGGAAYPASAQAAFLEELIERAETLPGVRAASGVTGAPLSGAGSRTGFWPLDRPAPEASEMPGADVRWVHRDYHTVLGIALRDGRLFEEADDANAPLVVLVNETGAERTWPGDRAIGKQIAMPWNDTLVAEVVGVVADIRHNGPDTEPYPMLYWEHRQFNAFNFMSLVVRTAVVPASTVVAGLRRELGEMDSGIPLGNVHAMADLFADAIRRSRLAAISLGMFALVALLLAGIGIYGVVAHATARRSREIGIRMALGAERKGILRMVLRDGMRQVGLAIALGSLGAMAMAGLLEGMVFNVSTTDPVTFIGTVGLLALIGFVATWLPALRASGIDPVESIRTE